MTEVIIEQNSEEQNEIETIIISKEEGVKKIIIKEVFEEQFEPEKEKLLLSKYSRNEEDLKDQF